MLDAQHRIHIAQRDDVVLELGVDRSQDLVELDRVVFVHDHGHVQIAHAVAAGTHRLEAAQVGTDHDGTPALRQDVVGGLLPDQLGVEQVEATIEQVEAIQDGGRKAEHMAKAIQPTGLAPQHTAQVGNRGPAGLGHRQHKIPGDGVQQQACHRPAQPLRHPHDEAQGQHVAAFALLHPDRRHVSLLLPLATRRG